MSEIDLFIAGGIALIIVLLFGYLVLVLYCGFVRGPGKCICGASR